MKNLNQLVCITLVVSCAHAFRAYVNAVAAAAPVQKLKISNGTDWQINVGYTTADNVGTNDSVAPHGTPLIIAIKPDSDVSYSLSREQGKVKTNPQQVPNSALKEGAFQVTPETIRELVAPYIATAVVAQAVAPALVAQAAAPAGTIVIPTPTKP